MSNTGKRRIKLSTPREIRTALSKIANMVLNDELQPTQANSIIMCANAILSSIRTDDQEKRIEELERILAKNLEPIEEKRLSRIG